MLGGQRNLGEGLFGRSTNWPRLRERTDSRMDPEAINDDLLYISNVYNVTVYSYPKGRRVGTLKGFIARSVSVLTKPAMSLSPTKILS